MAASLISSLVGGFLELTSCIGLFLNIGVLLAMYKGGLLRSIVPIIVGICNQKLSSPVYLLSSQTITVDMLQILIHFVYHSPAVVVQSDIFPSSLQFEAMAVFDFILMYCWYHNSLSHILIALNRLSVIVFERMDVFTRKRTMALCIVQHVAAATLCLLTQFTLPCCRITFSWVVFSYMYMTKTDIPKYSNEYVDLPLNSSCSLVSMMSYFVIGKTIIKSRSGSSTSNINTVKRNQEYKLTFQFGIMATVYSLAWIFFRLFPILIRNTDNLYIYGVVTVLNEINALTNASVYLLNNGEIKSSIRRMLGHSPSNVSETTLSTMYKLT